MSNFYREFRREEKGSRRLEVFDDPDKPATAYVVFMRLRLQHHDLRGILFDRLVVPAGLVDADAP